MLEAILGIGLPLLLIAWGIHAVLRRGFQFARLARDGRPVTGLVTQKPEYPGAIGSKRNSRRIAYEYQDAWGRTHSHTSIVSATFWNQHEVGGPIELVYSESRPEISAPAALVEHARDRLKSSTRT